MKRIFGIVLCICLMLTVSPMQAHATGTIIGQATAGENGATGNKAGDQSGREAATAAWGYGKGPYKWVYVFRAKDPETGKKLADTMIKACANNHIGYDLNDRVTCYDEAKKVGWDVEKINVNCETSCVDLVAVCLEAAGIHAPRGWASVSVYGDLMPTGLFDCYSSADYVASDAKLLPGDILCNPDGPHTAMVVESPNKFHFNVKYMDENGETRECEVEDGTELVLNPNNSTSPKTVMVEKTTDLTEYAPKRKGASFKGWEMDPDGTFSARYESTMMPIAVKGERKKIG